MQLYLVMLGEIGAIVGRAYLTLELLELLRLFFLLAFKL